MANPKNDAGIVATFEYLDDFREAVKKAQLDESFSGHITYAPTSYHELMDDAEELHGRSEVRWFTTVGAVSGIATGFGMPLLMDWDWPLVVGGKTAGIYSLPAYVVFGFELMVLFGAIATIFGMLFMGRLPNPKDKVRHVRITNDRFAIFLPGAKLQGNQAKLLESWGADEVLTSN